MNIYPSLAAALIAFAVTSLLGKLMIPWLRKLKFGQTILDIGPRWHKDKEGTPTMGGLMFIIGILPASLVGLLTLHLMQAEYTVRFNKLFPILLLAVAFGFIGFMDDFVKVSKKRNLGLTALQKIILQVAVAIIYLWTLFLNGTLSTIIVIPFIGQLDLGIFFYPLAVILIVGFCNGANLTDGIDGLLSGVTFVLGLAMMVICTFVGALEGTVAAAALVGGCAGFLVWNFHPAKVFMGDTGSMFLGAMAVGLCFAAGQPVLIFLVGAIYWIEALSVMIQVFYFKATHGKRLFKMTPIHHHFEMSGYGEVKIVMLFSAVTLIAGVIAVLSVLL